MSKLLGTIDIGNTNIKMGVYSLVHDKLVQSDFQKTKELGLEDLKHWIDKHQINAIAYCASGADHQDILNFLEAHESCLLLSHDVPMPIQLLYKTPETLGRDRIAALLGAQYLFPNENLLIIDAGTCITYEWLTNNGSYLGGNISPGMHLRIQAMHDHTAKLPKVKLDKEFDLIGQTTETALRNGAMMGTICEIESFIERSNALLGNFKPVITGGDGPLIQEHLKQDAYLSPDLVHLGLAALLIHNEY